MLIYNREWIDNIEITKQASGWMKKNLLAKDEYAAISEKYKSEYHTSNFFVRIGMFLFTLVIISSAVSLLNLIILSDLHFGFSFQCIFFAIAYYLAAEHFIKKDHYFRSGVTDALLYSSVFSMSFGIINLISGNSYDFNLDPLIYIACVLPFLIFTSIRFRDAFLTLLAYAAIFYFNVLLVLKTGTTGKLILPFEGMLFSFVAYKVIRNLKRKEEYHYWKNCILVLEIASLVTLYLSGNYLVVRELSIALLSADIAPGSDIPFSYFFYLYTLAVPIIYIWQGLKQKSYVLIRGGVILEAAGILSIRYYYSVLPIETALSLAGIIMIVIAWACIKYLKVPRNGIAMLEDETQDEAFETVGSILVSQAAGKAIQTNSGSPFGGGKSGAGGAGGAF